MDQISLNYEASAGDTHKQVVTSLPPEVVQCLENARFVRFIPIRPSSDQLHLSYDERPLSLHGPS